MIIFAFLALGLLSYNTAIDKPVSETKTTKEIYEKLKKERQ